MKEKIVSSTVINIINTAVSFAFSFVLTPIILNRIGQEQYGIWVFLSIFSASGYFSLLDLGMQGSAIKYIAHYHETGDKEELINTINSVFFFFTCMGLIAGAILLVLNNYFLSSLFNVPKQYFETVKMLVYFIAFSFLFQFPAMAFSAVVEGLQRYDILRGVTLFCSLLNLLLIALFLKFENGIVTVTLVSLLTSLVIGLLYLLASALLLPGYRLNPLKVHFASLRCLFDMGWKLILSKIVGLIFNQTQKIIIAMLLSMTVMAEFDIINRVYLIVLTVMSTMNGALVPFASRFHAANDEERLRVLFLRATKYAVLLTIPALVFFMSMSREFISTWVGASYSHLAPFASVLLLHCFFTVLTGVGATMMVGMNRVVELLKISVVAALLNLIISVVAAKPFGLWGMVAATVLSYTIAQILNIWMFRHIFNVTLSEFFKEVVAFPYFLGALLFAAVFYTKQKLVFANLLELSYLALAIYVTFFVLYLAGDGNERRSVLAMLRRQRA